MIVSYDIDGVLAQQPPPSEKKWGKMNGEERRARKQFLVDFYRESAALLNPSEEVFHTISARKNEERIFNCTQQWLNEHYPERVLSISLLNESRSVENVVKFKASVILEKGIQRHYEDNKKILKGLRECLPQEIELYFWKLGMDCPVVYELPVKKFQ